MSTFFTRIQEIVQKNKIPTENLCDEIDSPAAGAVFPSTHEIIRGGQIMEELRELQAVAQEIQSLSIFKPADNAWDRFKNLFKHSLYGYRSMEWNAAVTMAIAGAVGGMFVRHRAIATQNAIQRFKVQHNLSLFESNRDYVSRLTTFIGLNRLKEDVPNCLRLAAICSMSTFAITGMAGVRDRLVYADFIVGYSMVGFLYRLQKGVKAAFATGLIGSFFGLLFIGLLQPYLLYEKLTLDQFYKNYRQQYHIKQYQKGKFNQELADVMRQYNIDHIRGKAKVKELREQEKWRLATMRNLNTAAKLNPRPLAKFEPSTEIQSDTK